MGYPHVWLKAAIEEAAGSGVTAWPVEMTGGGEPPYVVYTRESTTLEQVLDDAYLEAPVHDQTAPVARFDLAIYADSYVEAWEIAGAIRSAIHKFSGSAHEQTIERCLVTDERDGDAGFLEGREQPTFTIEMTVEIAYLLE